MAKYSYELKRKIVEEDLSGKSSYRDLAMNYQEKLGGLSPKQYRERMKTA